MNICTKSVEIELRNLICRFLPILSKEVFVTLTDISNSIKWRRV